MLAALATTMAFTSCDESKDDHPVLKPNDGVIVENFLNTPEMSNMTVDFTEENKTDYLHMTCSQPSYGYAAMVSYQVELSLSPDFSTPVIEGLPVSVKIDTPFFECAQINPTYGDLAMAMSNLLGIRNDKEIPTGYYDIYARLVANVQTAANQDYPNTTYVSNIVKLTRANCTYLAIIIPNQPTGIYLRGGMNNWGDEYTVGDKTYTKEELLAPWEFLTTDVANVYEIASCAIDKDVEFKVADAAWAAVNCGLGDQTFAIGEPYELNGGDNPGNLVMPANFSGRVQLTKKGNSYTILFEPDEPDTPGNPSGIYLKGDMNGWADTDAGQFLTTDFKNNWLVQGVTIAKGQGFKIANTDWSTINLGLNDGETFEIGKTVKLVQGGGNMICPEDFAGDIKLKLQGGVYQMTLIAL